ncbi:hypothetical protein [Thermovibrio ammonificans]|uniref:ResB-like domain-containing protein n=1 Tax=Thermovibrio ammonificans (strain DSM 15698 / JCM 12110 / HB-1) TaxID=648996 RepID=E8T6Q7_THEA1|nr:hypothetical protein [Thermovibrio ammonificans]ADU96841.1 hypothetical protein Theam_0874 [Thermovibrio ammonificans HB-1]
MDFKSVKLTATFSVLFSLAAVGAVVVAGKVIPSWAILQSADRVKLAAAALGLIWFAFAAQTAYCRGKLDFKGIFHLTTAAAMAALLAFPLSVKAYQFYLYPQSFVKVDGKVVALTDLRFTKGGPVAHLFIEGKTKIEGEASFNSPLLSKEGFVWVKDVGFARGIPVVQLEFMEPTPVPFLFFLLFGASTLLLPFVYLKSGDRKGGRDVHKGRREGTPAANG